MDYLDPDQLGYSATTDLEKIFGTMNFVASERIRQVLEESKHSDKESKMDYNLSDLLQVLKKHDASDLHIKEGCPPTIRIHGELFNIGDYKLTPKDCRELIFSACNRYQQQRLTMGKEVDFAYTDGGVRFRINAFLQKSTFSASIRMIKTQIPSFEELGLPPQVAELVSYRHGLVLVTGPAGSGKSTTLAAMVDYINNREAKHIICIEDPLEYVHESKKSLISQREVGTDTLSFHHGLKTALRQDPDVILIGEMRDPVTIFIAAQAAETGHLVLSTLHTPNTVQAINRILDVFSGENQKQMRLLLASNLRGVISQRLIPRLDGEGRIPAVEVLIVTPTISSLILEEKVSEIYQYLVRGRSEGMQTMNQSLYLLYERGLISYDDALYYSDQQNELRLMIEGGQSPERLSDDALSSWI